MTHVRDYHAALGRLHKEPIALCDRDFAVLEEYGGSQQAELARKAFAAAVAPVTPRPAQPAQSVGAFATRAEVTKVLELFDTTITHLFKTHTFPRIIALEQRLAKIDGIAPPKGPAREKPKLKLAGEWTRKMFEPGAGVTHGGKLYQCVAATFGEPAQDTTSWKEVA